MNTLGSSSPPGTQGQSEAELLGQLRGLHLPDAVAFWPLAPGWWMLVGAMALLLVMGLVLEWRRRTTLAYRATLELRTIAKDHTRHPDARAVAAAGAVLIRRILVSREARRDTGAITGPAWQARLAQGTGGLAPEIAQFVAVAPYLPPSTPGGDAVPREALVAALARWIRANA